jgi:hypothetical protein
LRQIITDERAAGLVPIIFKSPFATTGYTSARQTASLVPPS